jgi:iron complex transport system substrate-binding protein
VESQRARLGAVRSRVAGLPRPRVMLLEWTDPPYAPGHWMPEMIVAAGGEPLLGTPGARSERVTWEAIRAARPDLVVAAPCGFGLAEATALADELVASGVLPPGVPVHAVDANAAWARPGTRLVDGVEELAAVLHPVPRIP